MIEITRSLARQLRAVVRKCAPPGSPRGSRPRLSLHCDGKGLRVRAHHTEVMLEYHQPGPRPPEVIPLPGEALEHFEGRKEDVVTLEDVGTGTVQARWDDGGVPQVREYAAPDKDSLPGFPEVPGRLTDPGPGLLKALVDASQTTARDGVRYAVQKLQLRGGTGEVVATDGKQVLIQGGFHFPWKEDLLVPSVPVFGCRELPLDGPVALGRTEKHVCLRVGPWTFFLAVDADSRFPRVEQVIPSLSGSSTTCRLSPEDATFLSRALPRLPGGGDENAPLTLDLDGHLAVRARAEGQGRITELVLSRSEVAGPPVRLVSSRVYLSRALELGFSGFCVTNPNVPVVCREEARTYLWMPLGGDGSLPPGDDVLRITSNGEEAPSPPPRKERRSEPMPKPQANGHGHGQVPLPAPSASATDPAPNGTSLGALVEEAQALKQALHDAYARSARLVAALKRQKKQSRLMATTLASLRQLQRLHPINE